MLSSAGLTEESVERIVSTADGLVTGHLTVGLDSMLQTVQFPATIPHLNSGLADMDRDTLALLAKNNGTEKQRETGAHTDFLFYR